MAESGPDRRKLAEQFRDECHSRGLASTHQRQVIYRVAASMTGHPTPEAIYDRVKREIPSISLATVYNCLDALVKSRLVRQVTVERGAARFCPNMREHYHFYCDGCDSVFDISPPAENGVALPKGFRVERYEVTIHGRCPACSSERGA